MSSANVSRPTLDTRFDILSVLKGGDSFRKTAMSRREDNLSRIDVTIMDRSAPAALPSPYSKTFPAFRAGAAVTHAAGLGGKRFIDFIEPHPCVSAFVPKHGSKRTPPRIEHGLRLPSLCKGGSVHVANESRSLSRGHTDIQIPASPGIFAEVTRTQLKVLQAITVPQRKPASREVDLPGAVANGPDLEGNPPQRAPHAAAFALDPQAQDADSRRSRPTVHIYSRATLRLENAEETMLDPQKCEPLFLAALNAGVSGGERR